MVHMKAQESKRFTPGDFARIHQKKTGLGSVAHELAAYRAEREPDVPEQWDPAAERTPENFAQPGQVFKDTDGQWRMWVAQMQYDQSVPTRYVDGKRMPLPQIPLTYEGWYAHGFDGIHMGSLDGGGWDRRRSLVNAETAWDLHGRTFSYEQVYDNVMPTDHLLEAVRVDSESAMAWGLEK